MFLTADGESGKAGGNETLRVDEEGQLRIKVPAALADHSAPILRIAAPVRFTHRGQELVGTGGGAAGSALRHQL